MIWKRAEVAPIPWQAGEPIWAVSSEDDVCSYRHCKSFSGAAFTKGSEEVTYANIIVENVQIFQGRKTIKSPLSDQVLFSGEGRKGRGVTGLSHSQPDCLLSEVALGKGSEAPRRSLSKLALGLCLCQQWALRGCCVSHSVIPACWRKLAPNKISSCCCLKLQQGSLLTIKKKIKTHTQKHITHTQKPPQPPTKTAQVLRSCQRGFASGQTQHNLFSFKFSPNTA